MPVNRSRAFTDLNELEIHDVLAERQQIAVIWCVEDVQQLRPDLDKCQAWTVLERCRMRHDANAGINWDVIQSTADDRFPEP